MEEIIRRYFRCWLDKNAAPLPDIFSKDITYTECYGPQYHGIGQLLRWFDDWNRNGTVLKWDIKKLWICGQTAIAEWYFRCSYCGTVQGFDGVTIAEFDDDGKISVLKEFQSRESHSHPYGEKSRRI